MADGYRTRQKEIIMEYFRACEGEHRMAVDIAEYLKGKGQNIALSTIYRTLERLENEGFLQKYVIDESSAACWQYIKEHSKCDAQFHLKCTSCRRLIHVDCNFLADVNEHIKEHHGFQIDSLKTVLYGKCADCAAGEVGV